MARTLLSRVCRLATNPLDYGHRVTENVSMTKPVRLGLIGCGGIVCMAHGPGYLANKEAVRVVAIADPVEDNRNWGGTFFGVPDDQLYSDYRDLLGSAETDAVTIATPHSMHAEQAMAAADAGVAVISEKPMATSLEEADAVLEAVERNKVPYGIVHNFLFTQSMQTALRKLEELPDPYLGRTSGMGLKPVGFGPDHENPALAWRASKAAGGGCINDTAYHEIYSLQALMRSPVRWVEARVRTLRLELDVDDVTLLLCEHENGALSTMERSWCARSPNRLFCEVHTTEGSIWLNNRKDETDGYRQSSPDGKWETIELPSSGFETTHGAYFAAAFGALGEGKELPVTGNDGRRNLALIEAARQASETRRAVDLREFGR